MGLPEVYPYSNSRICEHVTLHGKRNFADVIKVKGLNETILNTLGGPYLIT